jgi:hypothetical protein
VQQHLGRQAGVGKVDVSLIDGKVTILPLPDARLDPTQILKATYDSGVSVAEMVITATGWIEETAQGLVFKISGEQTFPIKPGSLPNGIQASAANGAAVRLRGLLYRKPAGKAQRKATNPLQLKILEMLK